MKKRLLILMTVTGMIILLGGLLTYGLGVHEIIPVPRPDLMKSLIPQLCWGE